MNRFSKWMLKKILRRLVVDRNLSFLIKELDKQLVYVYHEDNIYTRHTYVNKHVDAYYKPKKWNV
jgi:hypothetical protein